MPVDPQLLSLAHSVLQKNRDSAWDSRGTPAEKVSQSSPSCGTPKLVEHQSDNPDVPPSQTLGHGTVGQCEIPGTARGTVAGQYYGNVIAALRSSCPDLIDSDRWQQALRDAENFLATWEEQAHALGWTARELFGLHPVPSRPASSYSRLSRYDATGLIWLLQGRTVVALTATAAAIQTSSGGTVMYRRHNKPALGPLGDSLDDLGPCA
jgi:hypothetical protein